MYSTVVFFDGVCNLCNQSVQFLIRHDKKAVFKFSALQGQLAKEIIRDEAVMKSDSIVLLHRGKFRIKSSAALHILNLLGWPYRLAFVFILVPPFIRNAVYDWVASNRYKWFGRQDSCMIPSPELKERFLD